MAKYVLDKELYGPQLEDLEKHAKSPLCIVFALRLRQCLIDSGKSQDELAHKVGCSTGSISSYIMAKAEPKMEILYNIAQALNTTADYLIGLSEVKTPDINIIAISKYTGLSEKSIDNIKCIFSMAPSENFQNSKYALAHQYKYIFNTLIENGFLNDVVFSAETLYRKYTALRDRFPDDEVFIKLRNSKSPETEPFNYNAWQLQDSIFKLIITTIEIQYYTLRKQYQGQSG